MIVIRNSLNQTYCYSYKIICFLCFYILCLLFYFLFQYGNSGGPLVNLVSEGKLAGMCHTVYMYTVV